MLIWKAASGHMPGTMAQAARASDSVSHIHGPMADGGVCYIGHRVKKEKGWKARGVEGIADGKQREGGVRPGGQGAVRRGTKSLLRPRYGIPLAQARGLP